MKERLPGLVATALLLALVLGTWWAAEYTQRAVQIEAPRRITHEPDAWAENFVMIRTDATGLPVNRLEGHYLQHFPDDDSYEVTQVRATGQRPDSPITVGTADKAYMENDGQLITLKGNAHLHRVADADRAPLDIHSDELVLLPDEDIAYTDLDALVRQGHSTLNGTGMRYDNNSRTLKVFSATDARLSGQDRRPNDTPASQPDHTP